MSVMGLQQKDPSRSLVDKNREEANSGETTAVRPSAPLMHNIRTPESWLGGSKFYTGGTVSPVGAGICKQELVPLIQITLTEWPPHFHPQIRFRLNSPLLYAILVTKKGVLIQELLMEDL